MRIIILLILSNFAFANCQLDDPHTIISWNMKDLGKSKDASEIAIMADLIKHGDIVAVQEVVAGDGGVDAVERLVAQLNTTGATWQYFVSDKTTGEGVERYAYLWKSERVKSTANPYLDSELSNSIDREPFIASFAIENKKYSFVNFHAVPTAKDPAHEIVQLHNLDVIENKGKVFLMGDFNLGYRSDAFNDLEESGLNSHIRGKTALKLKRKDGEHLTHPYDNIFTRDVAVCSTAIHDFSHLYNTLKEARYISDHLPVEVSFEID